MYTQVIYPLTKQYENRFTFKLNDYDNNLIYTTIENHEYIFKNHYSKLNTPIIIFNDSKKYIK